MIITSQTTLTEFLTLLLKNRGLTKATVNEYLKPTNPSGLDLIKLLGINQKDFNKSVSRIKKAITSSENILIYGDYDVDGVTSTAILWQSLSSQKAHVTPFLPNRKNDGYGFKAASFLKLQKKLKKTFTLLITVDNGIVAGSEFNKIRQELDVIVVDHHISDDLKKLNIFSLIHSTLVSGAVLSWILSREFDKNADLGMAALGTVADCLPLTGINRNVVAYGLQSLRLNPPAGIKKLLEISGTKLENLSAYDLGFIIGPRINAVGRLKSPTDALRLVCSQNMVQATKYAAILNDTNKDRQILQQESIDLAKTKIKKNKNKLIFIADKTFHPGIIGLIAGRLTQEFYLPSVVISIDGDVAKGSCRSIDQLNIIESLRQFTPLFIDLGGHPGAAGFTIKTKNISSLQKKLTSYINKKLKNVDLKPTHNFDAKMELSAVTARNYQLTRKLEPFGIDNEQPQFIFENVKITNKRLVGSTQDHLSLKLDDPTTSNVENTMGSVSGIAFKQGRLDSSLKIGDSINVLASLSVNHWNDQDIPQLIVKEIIAG